jgi:hypothetical protein
MAWRRTLMVVPLVVALVSLALLAYASPPDPTYVAGVWDDGDYDDVVLLAASSTSVTDAHTPCILPLELVVVIAVSADDQLVGSQPFSSRRSRAPPTA